MKPDQLGRVTTDTVRKLVRLQLLAYRQLDSQHLEVTSPVGVSAVVNLLTGGWEADHASGKGIFSMGRHLGLDEQIVLESWTKAAGGGR